MFLLILLLRSGYIILRPNTRTVHASTTLVSTQTLLSSNNPIYKGAYTPYTQTGVQPQISSVVGSSAKVVNSGTTFSVLSGKLSSSFSAVAPSLSVAAKSILKYAGPVGLLYSAYDATKNVYEPAKGVGSSLEKLYDAMTLPPLIS